MEPIALISSVFAGNILAGIFFIGAWRVKDVKDDKDAPLWALLCLGIPLLFAGVSLAVTAP